MLQEQTISAYISILHEELLLATGCTEPIALAYCAAKVRRVLGALPERLKIEVSGNIMKNVKSVIVPIPADARASRPPWPRALWPETRTRCSR